MKTRPLRGLITGGSRGIGLEIAKSLLKAGAHVTLTARPSDEFDEVISHLSKTYEGQIDSISLDFSDIDEVEGVTLSETNGLDFLISNAATINPLGPLEQTCFEEWKKAVNVNMLAPVHFTRLALADMKKRNFGRIVFIGGGGAGAADPNFCAYSMTKGGMIAFAASLAEELNEFDIAVNSVLPGPTDTHMNQQKIDAGPNLIGEAYSAAITRQGKTPEKNIETLELIKTLIFAKTKDVNGRVLSANRDPWREMFEKKTNHLETQEAYTMQRVGKTKKN